MASPPLMAQGDNLADDESVLQVVRILMDEGFETLAGELLIAVASRRAGPTAEQDDEDEESLTANKRRRTAPAPGFEPTDLEFAMDFIHRRLVEPARALAEAERIAGALVGGPPSEIRFVDASGEDSFSERGLAPAGNAEAADDLERALDRIGRLQPEDGV